MANKMLIDAAHPEETRVVVLRGNRVEDFDFEAASKKPLRGNIYLAKVTRVEPSLQAAFIEYGGNRHGFLAFSEIHPDYYQIPVADRQALLEEDARAHREEEDEQRPGTPRRSRRHRRNGGDKRNAGAEGVTAESEHHDDAHDEQNPFVEDADPAPRAEEEVPVEAASTEETENSQSESADRAPDADDTAPVTDDEPEHNGERHEGPSSAMPMAAHEDAADRVVGEIEADQDTQHDDGGDVEQATAESGAHGGDEEHEEEVVEQLGGDALEDVPYRAPRLRRHYKIQEVIKRRQVLLVQVVKEERGNKGAALTTYLSLAGRYSVLMPNTARGGGISRKITDSDDRKRLKSIAQDLEVPEGMGIILRTAGAARSESEVKRDFEYLLRMWETVRELTLRSSAPTLVYEEGSLIKRAIRDLYSKDIDEVTVSGEDGYREARDFMRLLMPSHAKNVVLYKDPQPIFAKSGAEAQLDAMFSNHVTLKSGGYLVINQTEALVAIDVNSGRSTREHNIEDTALRTNLEAADEVARQLRLRDLAGLIVVDFIDMEEGRNNRAVERRIKDALKNDRARIQIGRISHFGLLEMSRQRIRTGIMEGSTVLCPHCAGAGTVRSTSSIALHVLRVLEDNLIRSAAYNLIVRTRIEVALYILNQKRAHLTELESRFGASVAVLADASLTGTVYHAIERGEPATPPAVVQAKHPGLGQDETPDTEDDEFETESEGDDEDASAERASERGAAEGAARSDDEEGGERRRRRRRRRRGRDRDPRSATGTDADADGEQPSDEGMENMARIGGDLPPIATELPGESAPSVEAGEGTDAAMPIAAEASVSASESSAAVAGGITAAEPVVAKEPTEAPRRRRSRRSAARVGDEAAESAEAAPRAEAETPAPRRSRRSRARVVEDEAPTLLGFEAPSADRDIEADTVKAHTSDAIAEPTLFEAPAPVEHPSEPAPQTLEATASEAPPVADAPAPAPVAAPVETNPEPAAPKRSGWWQRAKATITGE